MLLLGIDTSGKVASADLFDTENEIFLAQSSLYTQKTHSQVIMPMVKDILARFDKQMSDIGAIAVANGPGSYTGLRIGVAAVKAMCFGLGIQVLRRFDSFCTRFQQYGFCWQYMQHYEGKR